MSSPAAKSPYAGHRFPAEVISHAVWLYFRFPLSLRMVEEMLAARGIVVSHETVRQWALGAVAKAVGNRVQRLRRDDGTASGGEVNHALGRRLTQGLPAIDLAHADLA